MFGKMFSEQKWTLIGTLISLLAVAFYDSVQAFTVETVNFGSRGAATAAAAAAATTTTTTTSWGLGGLAVQSKQTLLYMNAGEADSAGPPPSSSAIDDLNLSEEEKLEMVGNLVADDEWMGVSMELTELIRTAVIEDVKKNAQEFLGKDDYQLGDMSKEIDSRVKESVADFRNKEDYEVGDFILAMDEMSKQMTEELTGKPYEAGDLSIELDKRVKSAVADFCDKDSYEFGDLSAAINRRVKERVEDYTGKPYEFGDVSRAIEEQRQAWMKDVLGEEAAANYQFGDLTKSAIQNFIGKDDYQFGDVTKKLMGNLFGKRKRGGDS